MFAATMLYVYNIGTDSLSACDLERLACQNDPGPALGLVLPIKPAAYELVPDRNEHVLSACCCFLGRIHASFRLGGQTGPFLNL